MAYDLVAKLRLQDDFSSKIKRAEGSVKSMDRAVKAAGTSISGLGSKVTSVVAKFGGLATAIGGIVATAGLVELSKQALKLSSDAEQAQIAFTTMLGSADKAQKFIAQLTKFAADTPFELPQLRTASKRLLAFGFAADQVLPMLTAVGNAASGLGLGAEGIDRITLALGQMHAKGKVQGDELLQLTEAGINASAILADKMKISQAQVMKLVSKGVIPADKAIQALIDGMNKEFPNMMDKQSKSLQGLWSTIHDTFDSQILKKWGDGLAQTLKPRFDALVTWINNNSTTIERWGNTLQRVANVASDWIVTKFQNAFAFLNTEFFNNPHFQNLSTEAKIKFVIDDAMNAFNKWLDNGGKGMLTNMGTQAVNLISSAVEEATPGIVKAATKVGDALISSVAQGIANHPMFAAVAGAVAGGVIGGPIGALIGAVSVGGAAAIYSNSAAHKGEDMTHNVAGFLDQLNSGDPNKPMFPGGGTISAPSHAGGLPRVPRDQYGAVLHKDEMVLTKSEADSYRRGGSAGVMVTGNTFIVRQDSDIDSIARSLARQLMALQGAVAQ